MPKTSQTPKILAAFLCVYIIWGSTYLAIRLTVETIPPWSSAFLRYAISSLALFALAWSRKETRLTRSQIGTAALSGAFLVGANGAVCVVEQWIASGIVAVMVGAIPIWFMIFGALFFKTGMPSYRKMAGAVVGLLGISMIARGSGEITFSNHTQTGLILLVFANWMWVLGTLFQKKMTSMTSTFLFTAWQMLLGSIVVLVLALIFESPWKMDWSQVSQQSWLALAYLIVFGSIIAFTAYSWLSRQVEPHLVSTHALVNPVIAVLLGWMIGERVNSEMAFATALVLLGLTLLLWSRKKAATGSNV